jgi:RND family efflux transporter MFP subunit
MKARWIFVAGLACLAVAIVMGILWLARGGSAAPPSLTLEPKPITRALAAVGQVRAAESVVVRARAAGQIMRLAKDEGQTVTKGQVLGQVLADQAGAAVAANAAAAETARRALAQAEADLSRAQALADKGLLAPAALEQRRLAVATGKAQLAQANALTAQARERVEDFVIRAPMTGVILERPVDPGQVVGLDTVIFRIAGNARVDIETEIDEGYAAAVKLGQIARAAPAGLVDTFPGTVSYVAPGVDPATGGRTIRISLDKPVDLPIGLSVDVTIDVDRQETALAIPRSAILSADESPQVAVLNADDEAELRTIRFVDWPAKEVIVVEGLKAGERIALDPRPFAKAQAAEAAAPRRGPF